MFRKFILVFGLIYNERYPLDEKKKGEKVCARASNSYKGKGLHTSASKKKKTEGWYWS